MSDPIETPTRLSPVGECRCLCGSLVARVVAGAVELKCRRCKRVLRVPLQAEAAVPGSNRARGDLPRVSAE